MHVAGLALGELVRADDDVRGLQWAKLALLDGGVIGLAFKDAARQEKLFREFLKSLLSQVRRRNDEHSPLALGPFPGKHEARFDGSPEADLIRKQSTLREGRLKRKQRRVNLMRVQIDLRARHRTRELFFAVGRETPSELICNVLGVVVGKVHRRHGNSRYMPADFQTFTSRSTRGLR